MTQLKYDETEHMRPMNRVLQKFGWDLTLAGSAMMGLFLIGESIGTILVAALTMVVMARVLRLTPKTFP